MWDYDFQRRPRPPDGLILSATSLVLLLLIITGGNCSALLSANIRTLQSAACETEDLIIKCPPKTAIHVQFANYGRLVSSRERPCHNAKPLASRSNISIFHSAYDVEEESKDCMASGSREKVIEMCQDKKSCRIPVNVETFKEDPCPRTWKYLEVAYKCKPNVFHNQVVCEDEQMTLECEQVTHRLAIQSAMFGRDRSDGASVCPGTKSAFGSPRTTNNDCVSSYATEMVMTKCQNERGCTLQADEATFGTQCPSGTRKFLSVSYACVPQRILITPTGRKDKPPNFPEVASEDDFDVDENSIAPQVSRDMQAIQPDLAISSRAGITNQFGRKTFGASTIPSSVGNYTQTFNVILDWIFALQNMSKKKESCILYASLAVGVGVLVLMTILLIHLLLTRRARKRSPAQTIISNGAASRGLNSKTKELRIPLYNTTFPDNDNDEMESLHPVDLTRYTPRSTLPRATSASIDIRKSSDAKSMHRLTTDGNFYA